MSDDIFILQPIKCDFRKISASAQEGLKSGRYSGSLHWEVPKFMEKVWVVLAYIDIDWVKLEQEKSKDEILLSCLAHLNKVPERKKHSKKEPRPKYGKLQPYKADFKVKDGKPFIICQFKTDERANTHFWGEGPSWNGEKIGKKRGRPPKVKVETDSVEKESEQVFLE